MVFSAFLGTISTWSILLNIILTPLLCGRVQVSPKCLVVSRYPRAHASGTWTSRAKSKTKRSAFGRECFHPRANILDPQRRSDSYSFFLSFFCCLFSFGVSLAFFCCSLLPLSFFPVSPISSSP